MAKWVWNFLPTVTIILFELIPDGGIIMVAFQKSWAQMKLPIKQSKVFVFFSLFTVSTNNAVPVGVLHFLTLYVCLESSRVDQLCTVKSPTEKKQSKKSKKQNKENPIQSSLLTHISEECLFGYFHHFPYLIFPSFLRVNHVSNRRGCFILFVGGCFFLFV